MAVVTNDPGILINGTYFDNFEALMQALALLGVDTYAIQQAGINTLELFKEALATKKIVPITTVREVIVGFAEVKGVDPANTTDISTRVMTDVGLGTGGSVVSYNMAGNKTLGLVAKMVAVSAVLSLFVSEVGAFLVPDEVQEDLITSADPYTIDHENIPVLIDENGKTHFEADFIEAIRSRCIELGVFGASSGYEPKYPTGSVPLLNIKPSNLIEIQDALESFHYMSTTWADNNNCYYAERYGTAPKVFIREAITYFKTHLSDLNIASTDMLILRQNPTGTSAPYRLQLELIKVDVSSILTENRTISRDSVGDYGYIVNGERENVFKLNSHIKSQANTSMLYYYARYRTSDTVPYDVSYGTGITTTTVSANVISPVGISPGNGARKLLITKVIVNSSGVEGITPAADLINAGIADTTKSIAEVIPALGNGEEISSPTVSDLLNKGVWYPISILKENVFTEGATETDTSSAPNGDVSPEMEPDILDKIKELIEEALRDPDNPDAPVQPTIPVRDSGDTPPANPPLISGTGNGLWGIYNPSLSDVQAFGSWLWSSNIVDQIMRMFNSPIEAVIGFHMIYCTPIEGSVENIKCGFLDSGVPSPTVANQYVTIDCGTIDIPEYYHTALDYVATKLMLYLPFIGTIPLSTEVCMGSQLKVIYRIDVLTGTCLAQVKVIKNNSDATMYAFPGNCAVQIPLTATTYTGMVGVLISGSSAVGSLLSGNLMSAVRHGANALASGINNLSGTQQSGSLGSNSGALGPRKPYLIITHPVAYDAMEYNTQYGYPINKTVSLGSLTGYTKVKDIHLSGIPCTDNELELIEQLLKEGVIIN